MARFHEPKAKSIPKNICHNFWPELSVLAKSWDTYFAYTNLVIF